jgi:hypothetical protein
MDRTGTKQRRDRGVRRRLRRASQSARAIRMQLRMLFLTKEETHNNDFPIHFRQFKTREIATIDGVDDGVEGSHARVSNVVRETRWNWRRER